MKKLIYTILIDGQVPYYHSTVYDIFKLKDVFSYIFKETEIDFLNNKSEEYFKDYDLKINLLLLDIENNKVLINSDNCSTFKEFNYEVFKN